MTMTRERFQWILVGLIIGIAFAMLGIGTSRSADAPTSGQDLVDYRVKRLKGTADAMQGLQQYDGSDAAIAAAAAGTVAAMAADLAALFPEGSGPGGEGIEKTRAKAEIWTDHEGFEAKAKAFEDAAALLTTAAAANDVGQIKTAMGEVGAACKACHEAYRGPKQD